MSSLKWTEIYYEGRSIKWKETIKEVVIRRLQEDILLQGEDKSFIEKNKKQIKDHIKLYYMEENDEKK